MPDQGSGVLRTCGSGILHAWRTACMAKSVVLCIALIPDVHETGDGVPVAMYLTVQQCEYRYQGTYERHVHVHTHKQRACTNAWSGSDL